MGGIKLATLAFAVVSAVTAQAQQASPGRIEIIGTRLPRSEISDSVTPVQVIDAEAIRRTGATTLAELLGSLATVGTGMLDGMADFTDAEGASGAALRGWANGTLVLLNGRRLSNYPMSFYPSL